MSSIDDYSQSNVQQKGLRYNQGKPSISQVPPEVIIAIAKVLDFGAIKYDKYNWRKGLSLTDTYDSAQRHLMKWLNGEDVDEESGLPHLWHAATNLAFLITFTENERYSSLDDRYKK